VRRPHSLAFPLIVKSVTEEASLGISQASIVGDDGYHVTRSHDSPCGEGGAKFKVGGNGATVRWA
jgi:hypothetical protein